MIIKLANTGEINPTELTESQIEDIEKLTCRWLFKSVLDFGMESYEIFRNSHDNIQDVGEDVTREILDKARGYNINKRVYGNVDYRKARYIMLPHNIIRQALFIDSKTERQNKSAAIQISQTSMRIRQIRNGSEIDEHGMIPETIELDHLNYLSTTGIIHFHYRMENENTRLQSIKIAIIPHGRLQN